MIKVIFQSGKILVLPSRDIKTVQALLALATQAEGKIIKASHVEQAE